MNYINIIEGFWKMNAYDRFSSSEIILYLYLLHICNQNYWNMPIACKTATLQSATDNATADATIDKDIDRDKYNYSFAHQKKNRGYGIDKQKDKNQRRSIDVSPATQEGYDAPF